jgi:hypothetical protein
MTWTRFSARTGWAEAQVEHTTMPKVPRFASPAIVGSATVPATALSLNTQPSGESSNDYPGRSVPPPTPETAGTSPVTPG